MTKVCPGPLARRRWPGGLVKMVTIVAIVAIVAIVGLPNAAIPAQGNAVVGVARSTRTARSAGVPAAAATLLGAAPSVRVTKQVSSNWSGYQVSGGPYSVVTGSFTVPGMSVGTPVGEQVSEWVGMDGTSQGVAPLIQAGVDEYANPINPMDTVAQAWWEVLPAGETKIATLNVGESDRVRVTIWRLSGAEWDINLADENTAESFTTPPERYRGPASTAEWIVEAPTLCRQHCQPSFLAPYTPDIVFGHLGLSGREGSLERITLVQDKAAVSTRPRFLLTVSVSPTRDRWLSTARYRCSGPGPSAKYLDIPPANGSYR